MGSIPVPAPPDVQPQQAPPQSIADKASQYLDTRKLSGQSVQQLQVEFQGLTQSLMKVVQLAQTVSPAMMGDLSKMAEVGKSIESQIQDLVEKQQGQQGATAPQPPSSQSPTDAAPAA